ncbi:transcriptional regulator, LysR family [Secundilactobacillus kimchicus JCM 15530]|uniref:Transcriptional regulator, LysR family n=1 Tax=Secundilactobacillus kimchicus JCM 15530 TaxID=1302272 RepID=A0A0R1HQI6_9LACO|nr:LysR family transcriptional regulator [Secundilactobacillus kimchicus]KRK48748.1 transcriptional regulator, LysR family [Secundilactobacillus kimchicus JCM 15530]
MQTRDLDYFIAVAKNLSFTGAAKQFQVTQPTITLAIKRLESQFDTPLFLRDKKQNSIQLSTAGSQLLVHANRIKQDIAEAQREIDNLKKEVIPLGLPPIIATYFFPKYVPKLIQKNLLGQINPVTIGSDKLLDELVSGTINIALIAHAPAITQSNRWGEIGQKILLAKHSFSIIDNVQQPLISKTGPLLPEEFLNLPLIALDDNFIHATVMNYLFEQGDFNKKIIFRTSEIQSLKKMVEAGAGIGLLTDLAIDNDDPLIQHSILFDAPLSFNVYLAYRSSHILSPIEKKIVSIFVN